MLDSASDELCQKCRHERQRIDQEWHEAKMRFDDALIRPKRAEYSAAVWAHVLRGAERLAATFATRCAHF